MTTAIDKIHEFDRFGSKLGLERVNELLRRLGDPHKDGDGYEPKYIHVAGTNGKGSVCKYLEQGLASCGYRMGLYTSPFIEKFNERIQCDGECITDEELETYANQALAKAAEMVADGLTSPTEFEVVMATAFLFFKAKKPDIVILEAGMGGIGDATNVIDQPMASVFTSVSFDHMKVLGDTLEAIATDKAGIIKPGCPVIANVSDHGAASVIARTAYEKGCRLYDVSKIKTQIDWESPRQQQVSMMLWQTDYSEVITTMVGPHQAENLKTALAVIEILRKSLKIKVERSRLYEGLKKAVQPGRFEVMEHAFGKAEGEPPMVIIDGAHNDAGAEALKNTMKRFFEGQKILLVTGMLADKETDKILGHFTEITKHIIVTKPDNPRRMEPEEIKKFLHERGVEVQVCQTSAEGVKLAEAAAKDFEVILFAGSLYLIGEIRGMLK